MPLGKQYWQISPGRKERNLWPEFSKNDIIAIGWDELGDLRKYSGMDDLGKELKRRWNEGRNSTRSCWHFSRNIKKNDIVVAKHGASKEIYGIGKVTKKYDFRDEREIFKHVIGVHWYVKFDDTIKVDVSKQFVQWTVHSLSEQRYLKIKDSILRNYPNLENNFRMMETGEGELDRGNKNLLDQAVSRFKGDPRSKFWKKEREGAYKRFRNKFKPKNLQVLTKDGFVEFLLPKNNKAWTGLYRHKSQITSNMEKLRNVLVYLQREEISIEERVFEVLVKKDGEFHIDGMGPNLATAILHVCDEEDRYGVWNNRSIKTLKRFELIPSTLPNNESKAYAIINKVLNDLKAKYNMDLADVDSFVYWADAFYGKAFLWSTDTEKYPNVIKNHQEQIRKMGATYWGVGFAVKTDEFGLPFEIPLPLDGYLYEKGDKVKFFAKIEAIESYEKEQLPKERDLRPPSYAGELFKTYLKLSKLEPLPRAMDISELRKWKDQKPVVHPPQNYVTIIEPKIRPVLKEREEEPELTQIDKFSVTHLLIGRNIVFYGPPGTGKTRKAKKLAEIFCGNNGYSLQTGNAEWTVYDVVGGPTMHGRFKPGFLSLAAKECRKRLEEKKCPHWLVLDELNRANLDLGFGKIFTLLDLDYREKQSVVDVNDVKGLVNEAEWSELKMPPEFRILATMNSYDRALLFSLGFAFRRRFAFVEIPSPFKKSDAQDYEFKDELWDEELSKVSGKFEEEMENIRREIGKNWISQGKFLSLPNSLKAAMGFAGDLKEQLERVSQRVLDREFDPYNIYDISVRLADYVTEKDIIEFGYAQPIDLIKFAITYLALFSSEDSRKTIIEAMDEAVKAYFIPQMEYFLPKVRREMTIGKGDGESEEEKLKKLIEYLRDLGLKKSASKLKNAKNRLKFGEIRIL